MVLLVACLLWWRGGGLGGILFDPDATVTRMPQHAGLRWSAWAVFAATTLLSAWVWLHALPLWAKAGGVIVVVAIAMLGCVLLRQILRWMGSSTQRTHMLPAMAGCVLPWLVCLLAAIVALKGQVALLRTGATGAGRHGAAGDVHLLLMLGALWWSVCAVQAVAAAGGCARTRAFGAWALTVAALGILIAVLRVPSGGGGIRLKSFGAATQASVASAGRCCVQGFAKARRAVTLPAPCCCRGAS